MSLRKNILLIAGSLILALVFFSIPSCAEESHRTFFKVGNLSCGACITKINAKLKTFEGYISLMANLDQGLVAVDHRQNFTDSQIAEVITALGYPAQVASQSEYDRHGSVSSESPGWRSSSDGFLSRILGIFSR